MTKPSLVRLRDNVGRAEEVIALLANKHRLLVLCQLIDGEQSVGALQQLTDLSQSALSQHLARLRKSQVVKTRRDGQSIHYSLCSDEVETVLETLEDLYCA